MEPYIREYGGGDDRWALCRSQMIFPLWNALTHWQGDLYEFAEYASQEAAFAALAEAGRRLPQAEEDGR